MAITREPAERRQLRDPYARRLASRLNPASTERVRRSARFQARSSRDPDEKCLERDRDTWRHFGQDRPPGSDDPPGATGDDVDDKRLLGDGRAVAHSSRGGR